MTAATTTTSYRPSNSPRRLQLAQAGVQVVAKQGLRGLTHRAVDRQAGFPEGTCSVSYRTRAALLQALTEYVGRILSDDLRAVAERIPTSDDPLSGLPEASALLERWATEDDGAKVIAILEMSLESLRMPDLLKPLQSWRAELVSTVEAVIGRNFSDNPRLRAEATVASIEGIMLCAMGLPTEQRAGYIRQTLAKVLEGTAQH